MTDSGIHLAPGSVAEQFAAVNVAHQTDPVAVGLLHPADIHPGHRFQRIDGIRAGVDDEIKDVPEISIGMFDAQFTRPLVLPGDAGLYIEGEDKVYVGNAAGGAAYMVGTYQAR